MSDYIKIETEDKKKVLSMLEEVIEQPITQRIYAQKLSNGNYEVEVINATEEPAISS